MRGEPPAILRGAADVVARAHRGEPLARAFVRTAHHSDRIACLLGQAHRAIVNLERGRIAVTGYSAPGHAYGPRPPPLRPIASAPFCPECVDAFPWHEHAGASVLVSPRQLGDPLGAALRTPWMGVQGLGAQYIQHDQDAKADLVPTPAYRWHWLEHDDPEGERC